jgi:hypothetical protein
VLTRAFINKAIRVGCNPLVPNYAGCIGMKPMYDTYGPLKSMDDILILTKRGAREVTTDKWVNLKGCPDTRGTTAKDWWWIIHKPSLHFCYVL